MRVDRIRPVRAAGFFLAVLAAGCASREPAFGVDVSAAGIRARETSRPILVLSLVGELKGKL